jgi:hypothetical protein
VARKTSQADRALSESLAARDLDVSPRKIESMRQAGLLEEARHQGLGRGAGSRSIRPAGEVERAEYMARLLDEGGGYADAVLATFVDGKYPIAKDRLERAYEQSIRAILRWIDKHAAPATSAFDAAFTVGAKVARHLAKERKFRPFRHRFRHLGHVHRDAPMHRVVQDFATDLVVLIIGVDGAPALTASATASVETLTGDGSISDPNPNDSATAPGGTPFAEIARELDLRGLLRVVRLATMEELTRARDAAKTLRAFGRAYGPFAQRRSSPGRAFAWLVVGSANDRTVAYSIPGFVVLRRLHGSKLDATIAIMAEWTPFFTAANIMLDQIPEDLQVLGRPNGYESLTIDQRQQLTQHLERLETTHARELEIIRNPPAIPEIPG